MQINNHQASIFNTFKQRHQSDKSLVLINIWDAASAALMQANKATAVATSSASLAWSLGYADGDKLPKEELLAAIKRIMRVLDIPLSVDIETGYSDDTSQVVALTKALSALGVAGINIEDGTKSPDLLSEKINTIKAQAPNLFINARCNVYLANLVEPEEQFSETLMRLNKYKSAGADGLFVPGLADTEKACELQNKLQLPINLMAGSNKDIENFKESGISRISVGPGSFLQAYGTLNSYCSDINFKGKFNSHTSYDGLNQLLYRVPQS